MAKARRRTGPRIQFGRGKALADEGQTEELPSVDRATQRGDDVDNWPLSTRNAALESCRRLRCDIARVERFLVWGDLRPEAVRKAVQSIPECYAVIAGSFMSVDGNCGAAK